MTDVSQLIDDAAARYGENADTAKRIAQIESGGRNVPNEQGSGAAGVFQFTPDTWKHYGNGASPYDVAANVDAGVRLLRDNRAALTKSLGRDPTGGELYMAHQQGAGGAAGLITNPDVAAAAVVGNRAVIANGGDAGMSAGQFASKWTDKFNGTQPLSGGYVPPIIHYNDLMAPPPVDPFSADSEAQRSAYRDGAAGALDALGDEYSANTIAGLAYRRAQMPEFQPDPNFNPTPDQIKQYATDPATHQTLPSDYLSRFYDATSDAQAKWIAKNAFDDLARRKRLATLSGRDSAFVGTLSTLLDPSTYAIGAATGGVLSPAEQVIARYGMGGMIGLRAVEGGAANVAYTAGLQHLGATQSPESYLSAAAMGIALGGAFGAVGRRADVRGEAEGLHAAGDSLGGHAAALDGEIFPPRGPRPSNSARIERGQTIDGEIVRDPPPPPRHLIEDAANSDAPLRAEMAKPSEEMDPDLSLTGPAKHPEVLTAANAPYTVGPAAPLGLAEAGGRFGLEGSGYGARSVSAQMHAPAIETLLGRDVPGTLATIFSHGVEGTTPERFTGMVAYHGTPARFPRFDDSYINSGEGAQAFGYGHYVAQRQGLAEHYRDAVTRQHATREPAVVNLDGVPAQRKSMSGLTPHLHPEDWAVASLKEQSGSVKKAASQIRRELRSLTTKAAEKRMLRQGGGNARWQAYVGGLEKNRDDAIALLNSGRLTYKPAGDWIAHNAGASHPEMVARKALVDKLAAEHEAAHTFQPDGYDAHDLMSNFYYDHAGGKKVGDPANRDRYVSEEYGEMTPEHVAYIEDGIRRASEAFDHLPEIKSRDINPTLYQVALKHGPERYLDWDKPHAEQTDFVKERLASIGIAKDITSGTGKSIYQSLERQHGSSKAAADHLHASGIPGIIYLDRASRKVGEGSRIAVVFRDHDIQITHANGEELAQPVSLPDYLRGEARASFQEEMRQAGVEGFSTTTLQRAEQALDKGATLDHGKAVEQAAISRSPEEVRDAVFERTTQSRNADAPRDGEEGAGPGPESEPAGAVERLRGALENSGPTGEAVREGVTRQVDRLSKDRSPAAQAAADRLYEELRALREEAEAERAKVDDVTPSPKAAGAAATEHPNVPLYTPAGDFESLREAGQFTSNFRTESAVKSHFAFPASGTQLASSPFSASRIIGAHLAGNPIGYKNAKNPLDVAMQATLLRDRFNGHLDRFLKPAFNEWAHDQGYSQVARLVKKPEFMRQVFNYINSKDETTNAHPAVRRYANEGVRPVMRDWTNLINESGLADHIPYDTTYLPRIFDPGKVGDAYRAYGSENLGKLVKASMADMPWTKALTDAQLTKVARGYAEGISKRALDLDDRWNASWSADNLQHLEGVLMSDAGMSQAEAKEITDTVARLTAKDRGANARLKNRVELNSEATHAATGPTKLSDLLVKDVGHLMERYNDQMAGRVAMARTKFTDPATGEVIQNGIKDDSEFETMISNWKRHVEDQYISRVSTPQENVNLLRWRDLDEANMRFQYGRILSKADDSKSWAAKMFGARTTSGQVMRIMRKYSFDRMMGATGWSHMSIFGANLANFGVRSALEHVPAFRHVMSQDGEWIMKHGLDRELEAIFGNHADPLRGLQLQDWEHDWGARPVSQRSILDKIEHVQAQSNKMTAIGSGLAHIIALNKRWAQKGVAQKFADMAAAAKPRSDGTFDLSSVNMRRMMQLGLDEGDMQKVLGQVQQHFTTEPGILFSHKVTKLNLDKWDQEAAHLFQGALRRWTDRVVQENDVGSLHRWVSSPLWQMMMQFRNFPMVGHTKQLMYNLAMHDKEAFSYFLVTSAVGAMIYYAREQVNSIGRSDRSDYLQRRLTPGNVAHAALYHSGYAGMMPTMIDTGLRLAGGDPLFDFRTTGNSSALWGAPAVTNIDDMMTAAKAVRRPLEEARDRSQAEARSLVRMFPWSNTLPGTLATNYAIRNMPERTPKEPRHAHGFDAVFGTGQ